MIIRNSQKGFSLMELLIVIAIMLILLSVSLFDYNKFGKEIDLENATYAIALAIRESQVYGINKALKKTDNPINTFGGDYGYGVFFSKRETGPANKSRLVFFVDSSTAPNNNKIFDGNCSGGSGDECYSQVSLNKGNHISDIKYYNNGSWTSVDSINLYFKRPNPDAVIKVNALDFGKERVRITITDSGNQFFRCVEVGTSGDISIKRNC